MQRAVGGSGCLPGWEIGFPELRHGLHPLPRRTVEYGGVEHLRPRRRLRLHFAADNVQVLEAVSEVVLERHLLDRSEIMLVPLLAQKTVHLPHGLLRVGCELGVVDEMHAVAPAASDRVAYGMVRAPDRALFFD